TARGDDLLLILRVRALEDGGVGGVLLEPAAHLGAVCRLLGCVVEIHELLLWLTDQSIYRLNGTPPRRRTSPQPQTRGFRRAAGRGARSRAPARRRARRRGR